MKLTNQPNIIKLTKLQSAALVFFVEVGLKQTSTSNLKAYQDAMPNNYSNSFHKLQTLKLVDYDRNLTELGNLVYTSIWHKHLG